MKYKNIIIVLVFSVASLFLWEHWIIYPFKLLVVLMHETGHALAALLTGGSVEGIEVNGRQGGLTATRGGIQFIILTAGYLGSSLIGALIISLSARKPWQNYLAEGFAVLIFLELLFWVRDWFTAVLAGCTTIVLIVISRVHKGLKILIMQVIGTMCCLYAIYDIKSDILSGQSWYSSGGQASDAQALADLTLIPSIVWGGLWILIAVVIFVLTVKRLPRDGGTEV